MMQNILVRLTRQENATHYRVSVGDTVTVPLEDYVAGVVASEIGNAHIEACRAQAIAARTFAHPYYSKGKTITDASSTHQAFRAPRVTSGLYPNAVQAALDTAGMLLTYNGKVLSTCSYSASNGGRTVSSAERWGGVRPWLIAQDDPWDSAASKGKKDGHGVGMSQVGAKYAASIGKTFREILAFYYPGTSILGINDPHEEEKPMPERINTPFTSEHFVAFCKSMVGQPYWYGGCVYKCTNSLLSRKTKQYPSHYKSSRTARYEDDIAKKKVCADCVGLIKGYAWTGGGKGVAEAIGTDKTFSSKYGGNGCPDKSASGMFAYAKKKGCAWGTIDTLPEIPGVALNAEGHVGVYVGGGYAVEARGFNYGIVKTRVKDRKWTHWYQLPFVDYGDAKFNGESSVETSTPALGSRLLKKGMKGADVKTLQQLLMSLGYALPKYGADGDYGSETEAAVRKFQRQEQLTVDGKYGDQTHRALMSAIEEAKPEDKPDENPPTDAPSVRVQAVSASGCVDVRTGNGTAYSRITAVNSGDTFEWVATAANGWHALRMVDQVGWISGEDSKLI